jgi:hypothetical protein
MQRAGEKRAFLQESVEMDAAFNAIGSLPSPHPRRWADLT